MNFIFLDSKNEERILKQLEFSLRLPNVLDFNGSNNEYKKEKEIICNILDEALKPSTYMTIDYYHIDVMEQLKQVINFVSGKTNNAPKDIGFYVGIADSVRNHYFSILFRVLSTKINGQDTITVILGSHYGINKAKDKISYTHCFDDNE